MSQLCDDETHTCQTDTRTTCTANVDCPRLSPSHDPQAIICDVTTGLCQRCVHDEDCVDSLGGAGRCVGFTCNPPDGGI
jgi:hypothetical protein